MVYAKRHTAEQAKEQAKEVINSAKAEGTKGKMAQAVSGRGGRAASKSFQQWTLHEVAELMDSRARR